MEAIRIEKLRKEYRDITAVDGLDLQISQGELISLLGINGAGKTTTIKMLSCLSRPSAGNAWIMGKSIITEPEEVKAVIGISPQETAVAPNLSVQENLALMCGVHGFDRDRTRKNVRDMTEKFGLGPILHKKARTLSGGWQRRLSIAMALIGEPKVLFLDEPTLGLDVIARKELWSLIQELKSGMTILLTTHYMEEAEALSDRIAVMKAGRLIALDTAEALKVQTGMATFEDAFIQLVKGGRA